MIKIEEIISLKEAELLLLFEAFQAKWQRLIKPLDFSRFCQLYGTLDSKEQLYRVTDEGKLAGIFGLSGKFSDRKVTYTGKKQLKNWRWYLGARLLDDQIKPNECYLSFITVAKDYRGKGVGTMCLNYIETYAKSIVDVDCVTLFVATSNEQATKLYQSKGYQIINEVSSLLTGHFVGERCWKKMKKKIK
ncbi:GNAT family N-acetyltransferase [Vagococcus coleopterorum]|uniref:GNAT family N-acetyltransferase n=1 Tax=Vagococcus coleopterorum TaxID=2714946 RepID=A0A6G8APJ2_9ENTE|nr:N-acetyltransferase [Vagococcus coleopterorum]QIL46862.1 GNAT family N-acetyltransferase [Vagococcus coleopterorum]